MKVKICGLRRVADAELALALGATHLGIVLADDSPRRATRREARAIASCAREAATVVLVFRGQSVEHVAAAADDLAVPHVQCHGFGTVPLDRLRAQGLQPLPVCAVAPGARRLPRLPLRPSAAAPGVLDGGAGGAGRTFDWSLLGAEAPEHVLVAGGITPHNCTALLPHRPWGIDVGSGLEDAPGRKDPGLVRELFAALAAYAEVAR